MSNTVDERVVSLRFDNSKFEANAQQSLETLTKLKESLDYNNLQNTKGLDKLNTLVGKVDFSNMEKGIDRVSSKFSIMGAVGFTAIQNVTTGVMNFGKKLLTAIPGQIKNGGISRSLKLEQAKFQLEGLGKVWDQNSKGFKEGMDTMKDAVLDAINTTAYGIGEAANVASQLSASGVPIEEMTAKLRGVAGVAAMTGSSFEDIGRIFIQTAGQGRVMGKQLLELSSRGINAAKTLSDYINNTEGAKDAIIDYAKSIGKYNKNVDAWAKSTKTTEADVRTLASAGVISFNMFSDAMEKAFGEHAAKANDTYTGSLMNMKAAFGRIGSEVATTQLVNLRYIFNGIREAVYNVLYVIFPFIEAINRISVVISQKIYSALDKFNQKLNKNRDKLKEWSQKQAKYTNDAEGIWRKFAKKFDKEQDNVTKTSEESNKKQTKAQQSLIKNHKKNTKAILVSSKELQAAMDIWYKGSYGDQPVREKNLKKAGLSYKNVQAAVNELCRVNWNLKKANIEVVKSENQRTRSAKAAAAATTGIAKASTEASKGVSDIKDNAEKAKETLSPLAATFKIISNVIKTVKNMASGLFGVLKVGFRFVKSLMTPVITFVTNGMANVSDKLLDLSNRFKKFSKELSGKAKPALDRLNKIIKEITPWFQKAYKYIGGKFTGAIHQYAVPALERFKDHLKSAKNRINEFVESHTTLSSIKDVFTGSVDSIGDKIASLAERFKNAIKKIKSSASFQAIKDRLLKFKEIVKALGNDVKLVLTDRIKKLVSYIKDLKIIDHVKDGFIKAMDAVNGFGKSLHENLDPLEKIKNLFDNGTVEKSLGAVNGITAGPMIGGGTSSESSDATSDRLEELKKSLKKLKKSYNSSGIPGLIDDIQKKIYETFNNSKWDLDKAIDRGIGVTKIVATLKLIKQAQQLTDSMSGTIKSFGKIFESTASAINASSSMMSAISNLSNKAAKSLKFQSLKAIAVSIALIAGSVYILSKLSIKELRNGLIAVGLIGALVIAMVKVVSGPNVDEKKFKAAAVTFISLGASMMLIAVAAKILGSIKPGDLMKAGLAIAALIGALVVAGKVLSGNKDGLLSFMAVSVAVGILVPAIWLASKLKLATVAKGTAAIMLFVTAIGLASRVAGKNKASFAALVGMGTAISLMVPAIAMLALLPLEKSLKAAGILSLILISFGTAIRIATNDAKLGDSFTIAAMGVMITVITTSLIALSLVPFERLLKSVVALTATMVALASAAKIAKAEKSNLAILTVLLGALSGIVWIMGTVDAGQASANMATMSVLILSVAAVCKLFSGSVGLFQAAIKAVGVLTVWIAALTAIQLALGALGTKFPGMEKILKKGVKIGGLIGEFVGAVVGGFIGGVASYGFVVIAKNLSTFIEDLQPFLAGVSSIDSSAVKGVKNLASAIMYLMAGKLLNQINSGPINSWYGGGMVEFANDIGRLIESLSEIDFESAPDEEEVTKASTVIKALGEAAMAIPSTGGVRGLIVGVKDLADFGIELKSFMNSMAGDKNGWLGNAEGVKKAQVTDIQQVATMIKALGEAAEMIPASTTNKTSFKQIVFGLKDLSDFGNELKEFVPNLNSAVKTIVSGEDGKGSYLTAENIAQVQNVADVVKALGEAADAIPTDIDSDSWKATIAGFKDLPEFAKGLEKIGGVLPGLVEASSVLDKDSTDKIMMMSNCISSLAKAAGTIETANKEAGGLGKATNEMVDKMGDFVTKLKDFVPDFKTFAQEAGKINAKDLDAATKVSNAINAIAQAYGILKESGFKESGDDIKTKITSLAEAIKAYADTINGLEIGNVQTNTDAISQSLKDVGAAMKDTKSDFKNSASDSVSGYAKGIADSEATKSATTNAETLRKTVLNSLKGDGSYTPYTTVGKTGAQKYSEGLLSGTPGAKSGGTALGNSAKSGAGSVSLYNTGHDVALGFSSGITSALNFAYAAGVAIAKAAEKGAKSKKGADVNSPSRKFIKIGKSVDEGFVLGIRKYSSMVYKESQKTAQKAVLGANTGYDNIINGLDNPTITPVVDLTYVRRGANQMNRILSTSGMVVDPGIVNGAINRQNGSQNAEILANKLEVIANNMKSETPSEIYNIGDVTLDVNKLEDVTTLNDFVSVLRQAKAFS